MCSRFWLVSFLWAAIAVLADRRVGAADPLVQGEMAMAPAAGAVLQVVAKEGVPRRGAAEWEPADPRVEVELARAPAERRRAGQRVALGPAALVAWPAAPAAWLALAAWLAPAA